MVRPFASSLAGQDQHRWSNVQTKAHHQKVKSEVGDTSFKCDRRSDKYTAFCLEGFWEEAAAGSGLGLFFGLVLHSYS